MVWPFKRRRKNKAQKDAAVAGRILAEKSSSSTFLPTSATAAPVGSPSSPPRRHTSRKVSKRRRSRGLPPPPEGMAPAGANPSKKILVASGKENMPMRRASIEDITALPISQTLHSSPHLRPVDAGRPAIPYNFRQPSGSQTSLHKADKKTSRPQTLRSRPSAYDDASLTRRKSSKRRVEERIREEEIRAMSAPIPIPKRSGDGPLRRDSKKIRSRGSHISLPPEGSIYSGMSSAAEQRGWEIGSLDMFNPRPAVRLSGTPQHVPSSVSSNLQAPRTNSQTAKMKRPETKDSSRKRQTIGEQADEFDAGDLRLLMERDAKRRERRRKEQQEKLDKKLRSREGRNRGDSDRRRREAEDAQRAEQARAGAQQHEAAEETEDNVLTPPTDIHPALRKQPVPAEAADLGIDTSRTQDSGTENATGTPATEQLGPASTGTYLHYKPASDGAADPFADASPLPSPAAESYRSIGRFTPVETPAEDPIVHTAQAVRMSTASTPPRSPIKAAQVERVPSNLAQSENQEDLVPPPPIAIENRRASDPQNHRPGAWASFFRRGGTTRKAGDGTKSPSSFSNTSRDSLRNQPLPAHLFDTRPLGPRRTSGTPVRTQSKFREDLPEMPIPPPDSRMPSPDVTTMAAVAATARRARKSQPVDIAEATTKEPEADPSSINRNDTPVTPGHRGHGLMSASLASIDSEGSWLASAKRQSGHSGVSRGIGSLSRRNPDFVASYEDFGGGDKDAEYISRPGMTRRISSPNALGGAPDEATEYDDPQTGEAAAEPITYHDSVQRQPTLVRRDLRAKSREALLTEYAAETVETPQGSPGHGSSNDATDAGDSPQKSEIQSARSIDYGKGHARQMSAGSARLLEIKRGSVGSGRTSPSAQSPLSGRFS